MTDQASPNPLGLSGEDDMGRRLLDLRSNSELRRRAEQLHELMSYANGTRWDVTVQRLVDDVATCILALERDPRAQVAWDGHFVVTREPNGYALHATAANLNTMRMDMESERRRRAAAELMAEPQLEPPSSRSGEQQ